MIDGEERAQISMVIKWVERSTYMIEQVLQIPGLPLLCRTNLVMAKNELVKHVMKPLHKILEK
jgi:hypothetical protein